MSNKPKPMNVSEALSLGQELRIARLEESIRNLIAAIEALDGQAAMPLDLARKLTTEVTIARNNL